MIDSVLKGTGNSRFLKSAVPAGTSWADALAMLQAGTFPIDFNGINNAGFQQVGTPLNKANLLKDATAAQIGLPPSTTPDGMFQALGNTGELHVWRKTVVTAESVPAGYKLGKIISSGNATDSGVSITGGYTNAGKVHINRFSAVNVSDDGTVTGDTSATGYSSYPVGQTVPNFDVGGYFLSLTETVNGTIWASEIEKDKIYYVPVGSSWFQGPGSALRFCLTSIQEVIGTPAIPAGTTTTYPVSTNPNAYQEGDDAKAAGYVVGEVKTDKKVVSALSNGGNTVYWTFSNTLTVADDGTISLANGTTLSLRALDSDAVSNAQPLIGKYACFSSMGTETTGTDFPLNQVIFFPSDTTFTMVSKVENGTNKNTIQASKYQPVTGYPAIPAGTTIEYLGRLGDKARVQVVSYVGTGTYGTEHPTVVNFDFPPKMVIIRQDNEAYYTFDWIIGMTGVEVHWDGSYNCFVAVDGTKLSFYSLSSPGCQMNKTGEKYYAIAIG